MTECVDVCVRRWTVNVCVHIYIYVGVCLSTSGPVQAHKPAVL